MKENNYSQFSKINLREFYKHINTSFIDWLTQSHNIRILDEETNIGIDIDFFKKNTNIKKYKADIVTKQECSEEKIIIENQLGKTSYDNLGKIITCATELNAKIIVWIAFNILKEHKQAIDWLNKSTNIKINIFLVEMKLYQTIDKEIIPKFNIISKPADWESTKSLFMNSCPVYK